MRKLLPISSLLFVLLCPSGLAFLFFAWQKYQLKENVKKQLLAGMDASELTVFKLSKADAGALLEWEEEGEFEYRGQMYDVVETAVEGDSIRYLCYPDVAESRLEKELRRLLAKPLNNDPATAGNAQRLISFYQSLFCVETPLCPLPARKSPQAHFFYASPFGVPEGPPHTPPPEEWANNTALI
ncbi:MAG: hypothetical protein KDD06_08180 [Phaeodactylibacter sp.]|nr:hypothetical protein [Phaeodactylibacter sp.]MCB9265607.1 hypothetical protein [Lewinellaceae bacterium]